MPHRPREQPLFTTINQFRATCREVLVGLFVQVLLACESAGLVMLGHVAIDGIWMKANASKHKGMSYGRTRADAANAEEDGLDGDAGTYDPQAEIRRREKRLTKMELAKQPFLAELEDHGMPFTRSPYSYRHTGRWRR